MTPNNKTQSSSEDVDPAKVLLAKRIGKEVIDCDPAILSLIVVDDLGRVLHVARSDRLPATDHVSAQMLPVFGTIAKMLVGAANNASQVMGATEAVIGVFKNQKVLIINLPEYGVILGLRLSRSSNAEYIRDVISDLLATRAES